MLIELIHTEILVKHSDTVVVYHEEPSSVKLNLTNRYVLIVGEDIVELNRLATDLPQNGIVKKAF